MVDAIVSSLVQQLTSLIDQEIREEVRLVAGVDKEVRKLTENLGAIQAVLADAERRYIKEATVKYWLDELKDVAYEMEDVLDEWNTARLKLQIEGADHDDQFKALASRKKVCSFLPSHCFGFKQIVLRRDIAHKINEINEKLEEIAKAKDMFHFNLYAVSSIDEKSKRAATISLVDESQICGRVIEKNILVSKLVCEKGTAQQNCLHIISLVGMGGIGKTTLAQLAYNNEEVKRNFDKIIWVCVSDSFDELRIAKAIIEVLEGFAPNLNELQPLIERIQKSILGKKFLLILDDVWNEDYNKWEPFSCCLKNGLHQSKILITTRKEIVARMMGSIDIISIKELSEEECWSLFNQLAFFGRSIEDCEKLEHIGRKIVGKCKGLPLATKAIGSLLRSKKTEEEWQRILNNEMWKIEELEKGLLPALLLSYNDLPSTVKRCFSYCAVFPKDYHFKKDDLIKLWIAQGYLNIKYDEEMEIIGEEYFDILATRSFFQEFKTDDDGNIIMCKMHDIVHDFAQFLTKDECYVLEVNGQEESSINSFNRKAHHLMLKFVGKEGFSGEEPSFPISTYKVKSLRSLLVDKHSISYISDSIQELFLGEMTCLRALNIGMIYGIPSEIGKLIHLRYANLSYQPIKKLPETLCELYNLQTLNIHSCSKLEELPQGIGKLINMRYLINDDTWSLNHMPVGIARLINLRELTKLVVDSGAGCSLESLKNLNHLRVCRIEGLGGVSDVDDAKKAEVKNKTNLSYLVLRFDKNTIEEGRRPTDQEEAEVLEALQPYPTLKKLDLYCYDGNTFPSWMMSLTNLRDLVLCTGRNCEHLPSLGKFPSLKKLVLLNMTGVKKLGNEFLGIVTDDCSCSCSSSSSSVVGFPKLKSLKFTRMSELEEWNYKITGEAEIMPRLSCLRISCCSKLKSLPDHVFQTTTLQTLFIQGSPILEKRYGNRSGEDWHKISRIPNVKIGNIFVQGTVKDF